MNPDSSRMQGRAWPCRWLAVPAMLAMLGLLMAFHQVVRGAVVRGEAMRKANAVLAESTWRCKAQRDHDLRDACRQQLLIPPFATVAGLSN